MQAQVPTDPYFALWSRLKDFRPETLSELIAGRQAVRVAAMRGTLHLMTADDAGGLRGLTQPTLSRLLQSTPFGKAAKGVDVDKVIAVGRKAVKRKPMTLAELRPVFAEAFPGKDANALSYVFHYSVPLVQVPPRGLWGEGGLPRVTTLDVWVRGKPKPAKVDVIVRRYLAAFGPASVMDAQAWSGLTKLAPVFDALRPKLVTFRDENGRELFDLPEAPRPDEATPAPPRFLPVYDNVTLGFANRDRILGLAPPRAVPQNLNVRAFTIDGFVAGFWKLEENDEDGGKATVTLEPFAKPRKREREALAAEARLMAAFAHPEVKTDVVFGKVY
jgi:hypothetical protein